jgi:hypothetical protein
MDCPPAFLLITVYCCDSKCTECRKGDHCLLSLGFKLQFKYKGL